MTGIAVKPEAGKPLTWRRGAVINSKIKNMIREENLNETNNRDFR
jgi:hypothetical protein